MKLCVSGATSKRRGGFTLMELLVSLLVTVIIILLVAQLLDNATATSRTANKHIDTDTQARVVLDHMALDIGRMLKRTDIDYYVKGTITYKGHGKGHGNGLKVVVGQQGNDQIAFYSQVPGLNYPATNNQGPISLVAYRINEDPNESITTDNPTYLRLQRMGKGLLWNGAGNGNTNIPVVFLPLTITATWAPATDPSTTDTPSSYETIAPGVFRFEYYYLLKSGIVSGAPWDQTARPTQTSLTNPVSIGLGDVEAIGVAIAAIDPGSRSLLYDANPPANAQGGPWHLLYSIVSDMADFADAKGKGNPAKNISDVENQWNSVVQSVASTGKTTDGSTVPPAAAKAIRIYNRYFDLKTL